MKKKLTDFAVAMTFLAIFLGTFATFNLLDSLIKWKSNPATSYTKLSLIMSL